ncbi:aminodeoxychorismate synthase component I [Roseovarius sp. EL26]|uniref:aminodeoxychorismate synthase component I n=1 Tax=Roseovarius sp. EL26 TaxID=2126672 RepID=UPI000EA2A15F|nr:aminodeoxychorismate synthase component I [Roseovarius sp. EL26]
MKIRFDHGPSEAPCCFSQPIKQIVAAEPADVPHALQQLDEARKAGHWLAGYASYELGYVLEPRLHALMPQHRRLPLLNFGVYEGPKAADPLAQADAGFAEFAAGWDQETYAEAFQKVHDYICAGDIYQANLTFPLAVQGQGEAEAIYRALCEVQPVRYGAMIQEAGRPDILSRSPELFFKTTPDGRVETRPMKGTQPRSEDATEDARRRYFLQTDEKNRAENLMIVDLLRNDISRICEVGSVEVPELFAIESFETVHQMTSLVAGQMHAGTELSDIFRALFPCGSITGAPKLRAMEIIAELEYQARDIYCGTIGWAAPDGHAEFNVAIRTLMMENTHVTMNVGGGVVYDSTAESEYEEALWKTRFARLLTRTSD